MVTVQRSVVLFGILLALGNLPGAASDAETFGELLRRADAAFSERYVEERMLEAIDLFEIALDRVDPEALGDQAFILNRLAQLCYEATTFSPGNTKEDWTLFERGREYGLRSLRLDPGFAREESEGFVEALSHVDDIAALLWTADNWGGLSGMNPIEGMLNLGKVRALYERGLALDETYWGASPHNALGAMLVVTPAALGGDPDAGIAHLERAVELAPDYLINRVVRAQYLGFDYDLFGRISGVRDAAFLESELNAVLAEPIGSWSFWNREAIKEAEALLERLEELRS